PGWDRSGGGFAALDLTEEQRSKLAALREQVRSKSWDTMGRLHGEQYKLRELLRGETVDPSAVADQQQKVDELRRQILKSRVEARNAMVAVLTPEQKQRLREHGPWWYGEGVEP
ncbi:MAG TPA: Spy/CpxP family protein refolding chaperone, partial [Casimicrobiaceae bacterium]|nr:Spy/CpxP family protein refolding chaperone [Casimicrobiaceae bacterium]